MRRKRDGEANQTTEYIGEENKLQTTEPEPSNANVAPTVHLEEVSWFSALIYSCVQFLDYKRSTYSGLSQKRPLDLPKKLSVQINLTDQPIVID